MATIQDLINSIPDAQDGNVITADYLVKTKQALAALAGQTGGTTSGQSASITFPANLLPIGKNTQWVVSIGVANDAGGVTDVWIPLNLPDGVVIQQMSAFGAKLNPAATGFVALGIQPIGGTAVTNLIMIDLTAAGNPFQLTGTPNVAGATPTSLKDLQTVKNSDFKYTIHAQAITTTAGVLSINAIRVVYTLP